MGKGGKEKGLLLDASYFDEDGKSVIALYVAQSGGNYWLKDPDFSPYFYALAGKDEEQKVLKELQGLTFGDAERFKAKGATATEMEIKGKKVIKIEFYKVAHVITARKTLSEMGYERHEYDIPYAKRYLLDKRLEPGNWAEYEVVEKEKIAVAAKPIAQQAPAAGGSEEIDEEEAENISASLRGEVKVIKNIKTIDGPFGGVGAAFDLETKMGKKFTIGGEPILMVSVVANDVAIGEKKPNYERVTSYDTKKVPGLEILNSEKEIVEELLKELNKKENCFLITYNGDNFDFAYTRERAKKFGLEFTINGFAPKSVRKGPDNAVKLLGIQHIDSFQIVRFLARTQAIHAVKLDIESVSESVFGEYKEKVLPREITEAWESKDAAKLARLVDYNLKDSRVAYRLAKEFLPFFVEISKLTSQTLYETTRSTTSQMVEDLLLKEAHMRGVIAPNKPKENEVAARSTNPIKGAFVKEPVAGLHENIAVLDFASLYPSIIISHNISPDTLDCGHAECKKNASPDGTYFCTKKKGPFPQILEQMLKTRLALKREYKRKKKEDGVDDRVLYAKQWALKIILNSVYGYLGYPRARWYSRECASATTAWEREYINATIAKAEKAGFKVLYGDSLTSDRFVTLRGPLGTIEVKNIQKLFDEVDAPIEIICNKQVKKVKGYFALSVDVNTRKAEWAPVLEIMRHDVNKRIFRVRQKYGETRVTEDHSIIAWDGAKLQETPPQQMQGKQFFIVDKIPQAGEISEIDLFELLQNHSCPRVYKGKNLASVARAEGDFVWYGLHNLVQPVKVKRRIRVGTPEFSSLCRLCGAYLAEGSATTRQTSTRKFGASIASSNVPWLKELQHDYHTLFHNAKTSIIQSTKKMRTIALTDGRTTTYEDTTHKLQMMNELSAVVLNALCGQKSIGKFLPQFIFNASSNHKKELLEKMIEGDGSHSVNTRLGYSDYYKKKNFTYTTKSVGIISGLSVLLRQLGVKHTINYRTTKKAYTLKTSTNHNSNLATTITGEPYTGFVYDLSVEKNNNFVDACGNVLVHNTDSTFLLMNEKTKKDVEAFAEKVNKELPQDMELEIDGYYKRGIFVTKKEGGAAKKRYALMDEKGGLKIVGFEYVRRDWCMLARETQKKVIEMVLSEGKPEEAVLLVKKVLKELKEGNVPKKDLVIMTVLQREPKDYAAIGPHVAAAERAIARGKELGVGSMLSFIVTKGTKGRQSISDKAELEEYVKEGDYDADYYIENQVLPAVIKILAELGYSKEDLISGGKQTGLGAWG